MGVQGFVLMPPHEDIFILHVFSLLGDIAFELVRGSGTGWRFTECQ